MPISVESIVRITCKGTALGQLIEFVTHCQVLTTDSPNTAFGDETDMALELAGDGFGADPYLDLYRAMLPTGYTCNAVSAQVIFPLAQQIARGDYFLSKNGTGGAGPSASNLACTATLANHRRGRPFLAKYHLGPIPDARYNNGVVSGAQITAMTAWATNMTRVPYTINLAGGAHSMDVRFGVFHRNPIPGFALRLHGFELFRINNLVRTQRRRTIGIGR